MLERTSEYFAPELLNRLDSILVFNKLSKESILEVVSLRLKDVADRLRDRRITLDVDADAKEWLAKKGYSDMYGARAVARVVRTEVSRVKRIHPRSETYDVAPRFCSRWLKKC